MRELKFVEEIWKNVPGYEDRYLASNLGQVKRINRTTRRGNILEDKILSQLINHKGYFTIRVILSDKHINTSAHRLIALAFIPNPDNLPQVNHIDGIKTNNFPDNLEWTDNSGNQLHAYRIGLKKLPIGELNANTSLTSKEVSQIIEEYNSGKLLPDISIERNINLSLLRTMIYGFSWKEEGKAIIKRDDRKFWTEERTRSSIIAKFESNKKLSIKVVAQYKDDIEINKFRSINQASIKTGIPRKSIEAVVNEKRFYNNSGGYSIMKKAGNFFWKAVDININQFIQLI